MEKPPAPVCLKSFPVQAKSVLLNQAMHSPETVFYTFGLLCTASKKITSSVSL